MPPSTERLPHNYDANARCEFHYGVVVHSTDNCFVLKCKVQYLLDAKAIEFTPATCPNVVQNPMPRHGGSIVNMIDDNGEMLNLVVNVEQVTTLLWYIKRYLLDNSIFPGCASDCAKCREQLKGCNDLKASIQFMINEGSLQFDRRPRY